MSYEYVSNRPVCLNVSGGIRRSPREEPGIPMNGLRRSCLDHLEVWVLSV